MVVLFISNPSCGCIKSLLLSYRNGGKIDRTKKKRRKPRQKLILLFFVTKK
jgi:hypothetical protein